MKKSVFRTLLFILGGILALLVLYHLYLSYLPEIKLLLHFDKHNQELLIKMIRGHGLEDIIFLFVLNTISVAIPGLSNGIFCVLNGILFGPAIGFIINWISDILGQIVLIFSLKSLYSPKKLQDKKIYHFLMNQAYPQVAMFIGYLIPFIPSAVVAYANALINKIFKKEIIPIIIGTAPMAYIYAYGGDAILHLNLQDIFQALGGFGTLAVLAIVILLALNIIRRIRKARN